MTLSTLFVLVGLQFGVQSHPAPSARPDPLGTLSRATALATRALGTVATAVAADESKAGAQVTFFNVNTRETETFFFRFDGAISAYDETRLMHIFRCKRSGHQKKPDRGLLQIIARLGERYQGHVFELVSAHRARRDDKERGSKHWTGSAIDVRVRGVSLVDVRTFVWHDLAQTMPIGLGHYHGEHFLHVDHRPGEPCEVDCSASGSCAEGVDCGDATECHVTCSGTGSCHGPIDCGAAGHCDVDCSGTGACQGSIDCQGGDCEIGCEATDTCAGPVSCESACECEVHCDGQGACGEGATCPPGCDEGAGCTSSGDCDSCT